MIRAVIFDCFGVLTADGWKHLREEFWGTEPDLTRHVCDMNRAVNAGYLEYGEFISEISRLSGLREEDVAHRINGTTPNTILFEFIRDQLEQRVKIGMLSNAADDLLDKLFEPWHLKLFDETVLSYQVGAVKPEQAMYLAIVQRLGVEPQECLFIDDSEDYCIAARDLGMKTIWHQDTHDTIARIKELTSA